MTWPGWTPREHTRTRWPSTNTEPPSTSFLARVRLMVGHSAGNARSRRSFARAGVTVTEATGFAVGTMRAPAYAVWWARARPRRRRPAARPAVHRRRGRGPARRRPQEGRRAGAAARGA